MGLANQVHPQDVFQEKVREYATELASNVSPRSLRVMKRQVYDAMFQTLGESMRPLLEVVRTMDEALAALGIQAARFEPLE